MKAGPYNVGVGLLFMAGVPLRSGFWGAQALVLPRLLLGDRHA